MDDVNNTLLQTWDTPYGLPPFSAVAAEHFMPAYATAMRAHRDEIDALAAGIDPPTFDNTVAAYDASGRALSRISALFYNLTASASSPALQAVQRDVAPLLAAHGSAILMHMPLFRRIDALHAERHALGLAPEQLRMLERVHLDFVRAGARLAPEQQARYAQVMQDLAKAETRFGQNILADETSYRLTLRTEADMAGLPEFVRAAARQAAVDRDVTDGSAVITLMRSHIVPFLTFSERRDLREAAWRAWVTRGEHDGDHDNRPVAREILALRVEQARLHGHANYAEYRLLDTMAGQRSAVERLLTQVWVPAKARAEEERAALHSVQLGRGESHTIEAWDWRFYAEKVRQLRYDLDDAVVKPYFPLTRMVEAAFDVAGRLFGLRFVARPEVAAYHPDVRVYEVQDATARPIAVFLQDNFARPGKRSGAWMSALRLQSRNGAIAAGDVLPIILNNSNFAKGAPGEPTLLSFEDATTLFHEFGHALHGMLSNVTYERLSGTSVLRDFVELPSQLFEHWLSEPEVLKTHARHVRTDEPIPDALIAKLAQAQHFNQGYETVRYVASAMLDMAAHARADAGGLDVTQFEADELARIGMPPGIGLMHRLPHFGHLFSSSGYAAGYYVYMWAEVLDADGYEAFVEAGDPFDPELAEKLKRFIYSTGNSVDPSETYRKFRGRDADVSALLRGRGFIA